MKRLAFIAVIFIALGTVSVWSNSPGTPGPSGYTLSDIYDYLNSGSTATISGHTFEPPSGAVPGDTRFKTLDQIYSDIKAKFEQCTATAANVEEGKTFFSTQPGSWGVQTGTKICPTAPGGWTLGIWSTGDVTCPTGWNADRTTHVVCGGYGVASTGAAMYWGAARTYETSCYGAPCEIQGWSGNDFCRNIPGAGTCLSPATTTLCR